MSRIFIDAGHGGSDPGATGNGLREKDLTLTIAKKIQALLKNVATVKLSRTTDKYLSLTERTNMANSWGADYFISIHINAGGGTGYEDYIFNGNVSNKTVSIRDTIHAEMIKQIPNVINRGKKKANFAVVRQTNMPAMLTENLFIDRKEDADLLKSNTFLNKIAQRHANGMIKAFGLGAPKESAPITSTPPKKQTGSTTTSKPKANLTVDGKWAEQTTRALQTALDTVVDGKLSGQLRNTVTSALYGNTVQFGSGASMVIRALQRLIGSKEDGLLGPATIWDLQVYLGTTKDGKLSRPSLVVKEMQRRLNTGTF